MKKILCLYYSGVGNTRVVAEYIGKYIKENRKQLIDVYSIENLPQNISYTDYDGIIIGYPTIHCSPAIRMSEFIRNSIKFETPIPYLFIQLVVSIKPIQQGFFQSYVKEKICLQY